VDIHGGAIDKRMNLFTVEEVKKVYTKVAEATDAKTGESSRGRS
jgi:hypothetical protein